MVVDEVSVNSFPFRIIKYIRGVPRSWCTPLFIAPQTSHVRIASLSPDDPSRRLPQSVQKTSEPIAAMGSWCFFLVMCQYSIRRDAEETWVVTVLIDW